MYMLPDVSMSGHGSTTRHKIRLDRFYLKSNYLFDFI
jgi:hypothetical protein